MTNVRPVLDRLTDRQLLDLRLCDLPLRIQGTRLEERIEKLYREMGARSLIFRPHVWLGEEWFTPDGVAGFAIPFYLAHPRLMKLERSQMLRLRAGEREHTTCGTKPGTRQCFQLTHAVPGRICLVVPRSLSEWYQPQPNSRDYVLNLTPGTPSASSQFR
jgi:hypothetical protein